MSKDLASPVLTKTVITAGEVQYFVEGGLTKREAFAMAALQGLLASSGVDTYLPNECARHVVNYVDELLMELSN